MTTTARQAPGRVRPPWGAWLRLLAAAGLLVVLFAVVDTGAWWATVRTLDPWIFVIGVGLYVAAQLLSAWRWSCVSAALKLPAAYPQLARWYFVGMFFNLFLPTGFGGDAVKTWTQGRAADGRYGTAAASVLWERATGLAGLAMLAGAAAWFVPGSAFAWPWRAGMIVLGVTGVVATFVVPRLAGQLGRLRPKLGRAFGPLALLAGRPGLGLMLLLLSLLVQALNVGLVVLLARGLGLELPVATLALAYGWITLATVLPLTLNGIGVREGGFVLLLAASGAPAAAGLALGLLVTITQAVASLGGLPFFLRAPIPSAPPPAHDHHAAA